MIAGDFIDKMCLASYVKNPKVFWLFFIFAAVFEIFFLVMVYLSGGSPSVHKVYVTASLTLPFVFGCYITVAFRADETARQQMENLGHLVILLVRGLIERVLLFFTIRQLNPTIEVQEEMAELRGRSSRDPNPPTETSL